MIRTPALHVAAAALLLVAARAPAGEPPRTLAVDAVELAAGREVPGEEALALVHGRYRYLFAAPESRAAFAADPAPYEIQLGGACARMGPLSGVGDAAIWAVHDGRIYIFASPSCRRTFLGRAADLLEADDPLPAWTPESRARGRDLLERAVEAMGGAGAIDSLRTCRRRVERRVESGEHAYDVRRSVQIEFPDRLARETRWDDRAWGQVVDGAAAFLFDPEESWAMVAAQRRAFEKELGRDPLLILRGRDAPGTIVSETGVESIDGRDAHLVAVSRGGATTTLVVDGADGRILAVRYRGRGPDAAFGRREDRFGDFRAVGGLVLPFAVEVSVDGSRAEALDVRYAAIEIDAPLDPSPFERGGAGE